MTAYGIRRFGEPRSYEIESVAQPTDVFGAYLIIHPRTVLGPSETTLKTGNLVISGIVLLQCSTSDVHLALLGLPRCSCTGRGEAPALFQYPRLSAAMLRGSYSPPEPYREN